MSADPRLIAAEPIFANCKSANFPWSVIASSPPNASLAAVLAGFMVTAAAFLLRRDDSTRKTGVQTYTLALFGSGVLVLGLDAYQFGNISALAPIVDSGQNVKPGETYPCAIAWTEAMPASSMLAIGACLMLAGLSWMMAQYFASEELPSRAMLSVPGVITGIVIVTSSLLLVRTVVLYFKVMKQQFDVPLPIDFVEHVSWVGWFLFSCIICLLVFRRTRGLIAYVRTSTNLTLKPNLAWLATASITTAVLAAVGTIFASFVGEHGPLIHEDTGLPTTLSIYTAFILGTLPVITTMLPIALAVPAAPTQATDQATAGE